MKYKSKRLATFTLLQIHNLHWTVISLISLTDSWTSFLAVHSTRTILASYFPRVLNTICPIVSQPWRPKCCSDFGTLTSRANSDEDCRMISESVPINSLPAESVTLQTSSLAGLLSKDEQLIVTSSSRGISFGPPIETPSEGTKNNPREITR